MHVRIVCDKANFLGILIHADAEKRAPPEKHKPIAPEHDPGVGRVASVGNVDTRLAATKQR